MQIEPDNGVTLPTIQQPVSFEADLGGANINFNVGDINPVLVRGIALSATNQNMSDAIVRLTSSSLTQTFGSMVVETETDQSGLFLVYALPGEWTMEIIPAPDEGGLTSPLEVAFTLGGSNFDFGHVQLAEDVELHREVLSADGYPAANVLVTFQEQGFNHATYTAYTDTDGNLDLLVPDVPLDVRLTPTQDFVSAVSRRELLNPAGPAVDDEGTWSLSAGVTLSGSVGRPGTNTGLSVVEVHDVNGVFYGSTLTNVEAHIPALLPERCAGTFRVHASVATPACTVGLHSRCKPAGSFRSGVCRNDRGARW